MPIEKGVEWTSNQMSALKATAEKFPHCLLNSGLEFGIQSLRLRHHVDFPVVVQDRGTPRTSQISAKNAGCLT